MSNLRRFSALFALALLASVIVYSQAVNATLLGTVTDSSGASVPNANVTLTETNTNISRTALTNESGNYSLPICLRAITPSRWS